MVIPQTYDILPKVRAYEAKQITRFAEDFISFGIWWREDWDFSETPYRAYLYYEDPHHHIYM